MTRQQKRISIDESLWDALQAASRAVHMKDHEYLEAAIQTSLFQHNTIRMLSELNTNLLANLVDTNSKIDTIYGFIVDLYRAEVVDDDQPPTGI